MIKTFLKLRQLFLLMLMIFLFVKNTSAQYKDYKLSPNGDTLNIIDEKGLKQGKWVNTVGEIRGNPGYEEEGYFKNDKKTGVWRGYSSNGDLIYMENYRFGGKDGLQQYFTFLGSLERQEEWRGYNPDAPYDTIPIYGTASNEIIEYKIVKAEQYSVPHGEWKYFDGSGRITKIERFDRGSPIKDGPAKSTVAAEAAKPKEKVKTKEILEYEKKYSKKKRAQMEREGKTSL
jgi:antitoxin component YwqK of YwqJK toxin-antitoxin module